MTTFRSIKGLSRFTERRSRRFTSGRGVHALRHVRRPGRLALHHEGARFRGHRE